jgi:hypothetical protein
MTGLRHDPRGHAHFQLLLLALVAALALLLLSDTPVLRALFG